MSVKLITFTPFAIALSKYILGSSTVGSLSQIIISAFTLILLSKSAITKPSPAFLPLPQNTATRLFARLSPKILHIFSKQAVPALSISPASVESVLNAFSSTAFICFAVNILILSPSFIVKLLYFTHHHIITVAIA